MVKSRVIQMDNDPVPQVTSQPSKNKRKQGTDVETVSCPVTKPTPSTRKDVSWELLSQEYGTQSEELGAKEALNNLHLLSKVSWKGKVSQILTYLEIVA